MVQAVMDDWRTAPVPEDVRAVLEFLTKFVPPDQTFGAEDVQKMRDVGLSKEAIRDAMYASWAFQNLSRWMDAFGFATHNEAQLSFAGRILWRMNYRMPVIGK